MAEATSPRRPPPPPLNHGCALFLDVDGTLLEFAARPELVRLPAGALDTIAILGDRLDGALALVSGRPLEQLDALFAPLRLPAAGLHGQQFRGLDAPVAGRSGDALNALRQAALRLAGRLPGVMVEDKGSNLALHWRTAPAAEPQVRAMAKRHIAHLPGYRLQPGDHVIEFVPADVDKGRAVEALMAQAPFRGRTPVFVGDDLTDEFGFAAVQAACGWSVLVGEREPSAARYGLSDPAAVHAWLRDNAAWLQEAPP
ncbi:MAG TPA: trehalose-phosphatase [Pseudoxanthomonas sp.]|nr:trehalose-phosphatase [Pseudoxanthomonas sp.]